MTRLPRHAHRLGLASLALGRLPLATLALATLPLATLPLGLGCGDKDTGDPTTGTDAGTTTASQCELTLATAGDVTNDPECLAIVDILAGMEIQWQWEGNSTYPDYNGIIATPVVGDVDGDGMPEVVFTTITGAYYDYPGLLIVVDGETGEEELMIDAIGDDDYVAGASGVALADLDADGVVEIVTTTYNGSVAAFHADGELVWVSADRADDLTLWTSPAIADLDGDGMAEVAAGRAIFGSNGAYRLSSTLDGWGGIAYSSIIADLGGDGTPEVIAGNHAFTLDGDLVFDVSETVADGMPAVGDFDGDGQGEVVLSSWTYGTVTMLDTDGTLLWETTIHAPASKKDVGGGGPPAVADFNGDGLLEIAVYGGDAVYLLGPSGDIEWSFPVTDEFAYLGGVSGFDFDDDGNVEVIATDFYSLYVLSGDDGSVIMQADEFSGINIMGNPVVADVDGDGRAELLAGTNNSGSDEWSGLVALRGIYDSWSPAPSSYTQHAWYPGVLNDDLTAPTSPTTPWDDGDDLFRVSPNGERGDVYASAPNLSSEITDSCFDCSPGLVRFEAALQVSNIGALDLDADTAVGIYGVTADGRRELIDTTTLSGGLAAGKSTDGVQVSGQFATSVGFVALESQVDGSEIRATENIGDRNYLDCDPADNIFRVEIPCE